MMETKVRARQRDGARERSVLPSLILNPQRLGFQASSKHQPNNVQRSLNEMVLTKISINFIDPTVGKLLFQLQYKQNKQGVQDKRE